jgi:hypothetical protein
MLRWFVCIGRAAWAWSLRGIRLGPPCALALAALACNARWSECDDESSAECDLSIEQPPVEPPTDDPYAGTLTCPLSLTRDPEQGICQPLVDNGWHLGLFRIEDLPEEQLRCPDIAPSSGLEGMEIALDRTTPRRVLGCSITPFPTCESEGALVCVPSERGFRTCVSQDGPQDCPFPEYPEEIAVEKDGDGGLVTVCCRRSASRGPE